MSIINLLNMDLPRHWQLGFQDAATSVMEGLVDLHHSIMFYLILITLFVFWLIFVIVKDFGDLDNNRTYKNIRSSVAMRNQTHGVVIEVIWTLIPTFILIFIAIPSFALLYSMEDILGYYDTLKVIGYQWYWTYEFSFEPCDWMYYSILHQPSAGFFNKTYHSDEHGDLTLHLKTPGVFRVRNDQKAAHHVIESNLLSDSSRDYFMYWTSVFMGKDNDIDKHQNWAFPYFFRLLEVDRVLLIPLRYSVRLLITASDVLHSFAVPSFGIKVDAVPGRINSTVLQVKRPGVFYGQCSELCGVNHGFMPIEIRVPQYTENPLHDIAFLYKTVDPKGPQENNLDFILKNNYLK